MKIIRGILGSFSFLKSGFYLTPPEWYFVTIVTILKEPNIIIMTTKAAQVYLVPAGTGHNSKSIKEAAALVIHLTEYTRSKLSTSELSTCDYVVYALNNSKNIYIASRLTSLQYPLNNPMPPAKSGIRISYVPVYKSINFKSLNELGKIDAYDILCKNVGSKKCDGTAYNFTEHGLNTGVYLTKTSKINSLCSIFTNN